MTENTRAKASVSKSYTPEAPLLKWEVFVTLGIPVVTPDRPKGVSETFFQAMAATLIYGAKDAVLVEAFMTVKQGKALADWIESKGKNLTTIYIIHGHGDHWFAAGTLLERFPEARVVATPNTVKVMRRNASPKALHKAWEPQFPGQIPANLVIAEELKGNVLDLEGQELVVVELGHTDTDLTTCLFVPSIGLVVAGDAAYNDTFILPSRMPRDGRNGFPRSTRSSRSTRRQLSLRTNDLKILIVPELSKRRGSTSAISTD